MGKEADFTADIKPFPRLAQLSTEGDHLGLRYLSCLTGDTEETNMVWMWAAKNQKKRQCLLQLAQVYEMERRYTTLRLCPRRKGVQCAFKFLDFSGYCTRENRHVGYYGYYRSVRQEKVLWLLKREGESEVCISIGKVWGAPQISSQSERWRSFPLHTICKIQDRRLSL